MCLCLFAKVPWIHAGTVRWWYFERLALSHGIVQAWSAPVIHLLFYCVFLSFYCLQCSRLLPQGEGAFWRNEFSRFWAEIQILTENRLLEQFFCFFLPWQGGTTLGHGFSGSWAEIQILKESCLLKQFFCLFQSWQGGTTLGYAFSRFGTEIQILTENHLLEQFFCLFQPWQGGTTLGYGFSRLWALKNLAKRVVHSKKWKKNKLPMYLAFCIVFWFQIWEEKVLCSSL